MLHQMLFVERGKSLSMDGIINRLFDSVIWSCRIPKLERIADALQDCIGPFYAIVVFTPACMQATCFVLYEDHSICTHSQDEAR